MCSSQRNQTKNVPTATFCIERHRINPSTFVPLLLLLFSLLLLLLLLLVSFYISDVRLAVQQPRLSPSHRLMKRDNMAIKLWPWRPEIVGV